MKEKWYAAWLTPIGAMVLLLILNFGIVTWLAFDAQQQRTRIDTQVVQHRVRNEKVHEELADFILCLADNLPGTPERDLCIKGAKASAK